MCDRQNREITITVSGDNAYASYEGQRVGRVETTGFVEQEHGMDLAPTITGMFVDKPFQKSGIGLALIEALFDHFGVPLFPGHRNEGIGDTNALTDAGEALVRKAQARKFVRPFPEDNPYDDD